MRCVISLIFFFVFMVHVSAAVQIVEFCPDPYQYNDADEYLVLSGNGPLDEITISDSKGGFQFRPEQPSGDP